MTGSCGSRRGRAAKAAGPTLPLLRVSRLAESRRDYPLSHARWSELSGSSHAAPTADHGCGGRWRRRATRGWAVCVVGLPASQPIWEMG